MNYIIIPGSVSTIGTQAFAACEGLQIVIIENGVKTIKDEVFTESDALTDIAIPASVISIHADAFYNWINEFTIHGTAGSEAETFAKKIGVPFSTETLTIPEEWLATPTPKPVKTPEPSALPSASATPSVSRVPAASEIPKVSAVPSVSQTPSVVSAAPSRSAMPLASQAPSVSAAPLFSAMPSASQTPSVSVMPLSSKIPESSVPNISSNPAASKTPAVSESPSASVRPAFSELPSASAKPVTSKTPAESRTPIESKVPDKSGTPSVSPSAKPQKVVITEIIQNDDGSVTNKVTEKETGTDGTISEKITETTTKANGSVVEKIGETITKPDGSRETANKETITNTDGTVTEEEVRRLEDKTGLLTEIFSQLKKIAEELYERITRIEKMLENGMLLQKEIKESSRMVDGAVVKETDVVDTKKDRQGKEVEKYEYSTKALPKEVEWIIVETQPLKDEQQALSRHNAKEYIMYEIVPQLDGKKADVGEGSVKVRLYCGKKDWKNVKVFDVERNVWLEAVYEDGYVVFEAAHFSKYAVAEINTSKKGDVNSDGQIKLADAQLALKAALNLTALNKEQTAAADVDGNGKVDLADAQRILKAALNLITL